MTERDAHALIDSLLRWYTRHHRKLAWRPAPGKLADPYHTLVAEAMLQQTQVATVIGHFERFITRFPRLDDLAGASEDDVLSMWQGLGYYRRARHVHAAARAIRDEHGGEVPRDAAALHRLPGVGRYTAGAIASIAFGEREPLVDGNVARVLARITAYEEPVDSTDGRRRMWDEAAAWVARLDTHRRRHAGDWNQALMELGARICTPRSPACDRCPVAQWCEAKRRGIVDRIPASERRTEARRVVHRVLAMDRNGRWLLEQRGDEGMWAGMWQMPTLEGELIEHPRGADHARPTTRGLIRWAHDRFGLVVARPRHVGSFDHVTSHRLIRFDVFAAPVTAGRLRSGTARWRRLGDIDDLAMSRAQRRVVDILDTGAKTHAKSLQNPDSD